MEREREAAYFCFLTIYLFGSFLDMLFPDYTYTRYGLNIVPKRHKHKIIYGIDYEKNKKQIKREKQSHTRENDLRSSADAYVYG